MNTKIQNMAPIQMNPNKLFYYKCLDCLTPVAVDDRNIENLRCDCEGSNLTFMGQVVGQSYVKTEEQCKCNEICAHASGPNCSCKCGSVNHGLKMKAYIQVNKVTGKVEQRIRCKSEAINHAVWYRSIKTQMQDDSIYGYLNEARENMKKGTRCDYGTYLAISKISYLKMEFHKAKTVKKRESVYAKIQLLSTRQVPETVVSNEIQTASA